MSRRTRIALIVFVAMTTALVALSNLTPISESDFWLQLAVGNEIRATGAIPRTIEFAFTEARDRDFVAHEWIPSVITSALFPSIGYPGMIVLKCALALLTTAFAFALALRLNGSPAVSVAIATAASIAMNFRFQMRPEIFAFAFAFGCVYLLTAFAQGGRRLWLVGLVPLAVAWANCHASILIGLALPWIFLAGGLIDDARSGALHDPGSRAQRARRIHLPLAAAAVAMMLAALVNPFGLRLLEHGLAFSRATYLRSNIVEFGSTFGEQTRQAPYFWVYLAYAVVVCGAAAWKRSRLDGTSLVLLASFGWMSVDAIRFTAWFAIAGTYVLGRTTAGFDRSEATQRRWMRAGTIAAAVATAIVLAHGDVRGHRVGFRDESPMSPEALRFVRDAAIGGNVFNTFSHGDQLIWAFYPRIRVVIDSRIDAYGEAYYLRYRSLCGRSFKALGPPADLAAFLDRYGVGTIVTRPLDFKNWSDKGHVTALEAAGFSVVFADPTTVILRRGV